MNEIDPTSIPELNDPPRRPRGRPPNIPMPQATLSTPIESDDDPPVSYRPEDPRARAARRALELRDHLGTMDNGTDEFYIDPRIIPDGWSYEWKRHTLLNQEDPSYNVSIATRGWESVPAYRHPELMPKGYDGKGPILKKGMILMERPLEITEEVKRMEERKAREQVNQKEQQLNGAPAGTFERDNKGTPMAKIKRGFEPMKIPEK